MGQSMKNTKSDLAQEFQRTGFLHIKSLVDLRTCEKLIDRMRDLVARFAPRDRAKIFNTGPEAQTADQHFLESARKISFFFDKNNNNKSNTFESLNKVGHALHDLCPVYAKFSHQEKFYALM